MPDMRESLFWDKTLETDLPDSRLRFGDREKHQFKLGRMEMDLVYCSGPCARPMGAVPVHCPHVFFICDDCFLAANNIAPPGTRQLTPEEERDMIRGQPPG
jgi:hypothetical protein